MASTERILAVDLLGVALVLEEFDRARRRRDRDLEHGRLHACAVAGGTGRALARARRRPAAVPAAGRRCQLDGRVQLVKRANNLRVQAASIDWGERGARVSSISPGIIATPLRSTRASSIGAVYRSMIEVSSSSASERRMKLRPPRPTCWDRTRPS
jgi:NAD(P)-dependent dehydrogenase (short-subunit alcohol dehydrogenase family)